MRNDEFLICKCCNSKHQMRFIWWDDGDNDGEVYVEILLNPEYRWWKRVIGAVKYIFGYRSKYGMFDEIILDKKDIPKLEKIIEYLKRSR